MIAPCTLALAWPIVRESDCGIYFGITATGSGHGRIESEIEAATSEMFSVKGLRFDY